MKISKLLAEYLLTRGCDQNGIGSEIYHNLDHENVSVLECQPLPGRFLSFTIIVDTIGLLYARYDPEDFANSTCFHQYAVGE